MPSQISLSDPDLADLIEDAKQLQLAMMPRPRTMSPRVIDLTRSEVRIPEPVARLIGGLDPYGT
jgi:hypothetical protein